MYLYAGCVMPGLVDAGEEYSNLPVFHTSIFQFGSECPYSTLILAWDSDPLSLKMSCPILKYHASSTKQLVNIEGRQYK